MAFFPFHRISFFYQGVHLDEELEIMGGYGRGWEREVTFLEHLSYARHGIREFLYTQAQAIQEVGININTLQRRKLRFRDVQYHSTKIYWPKEMLFRFLSH